MPLWNPGDRIITVVYLDEDAARTTTAVADLLRERWETGDVAAELAIPLRSMVTYEAWPAE
jgi:hypothetical protein